MSAFKLLAIRPLVGCHKHFLKNLIPGEIYRFYSSFRYLDIDGNDVDGTNEVCKIIQEQKVPQDFYNIETADNHQLNISISGVAGKNGTGKSTLMDMLFAAIFVYSAQEHLLNPNLESLQKNEKDLEFSSRELDIQLTNLDARRDELLRHMYRDGNLKDSLQRSPSSIYHEFEDYFERKREIEGGRQNLLKETKRLEEVKKSIIETTQQLAVEIYYELDDIFFRLNINSSEAKIEVCLFDSKWSKVRDSPHNFIGMHLFYTIAVNYSHYGLNSKYLGEWINALFHKNDGYKTPIVINPMRNEGNFSINTEIGFAKYRLLCNVLTAQREISRTKRNDNIYLNDKHFVKRITLKINQRKLEDQVVYLNNKSSYDHKKGVSAVYELLYLYYPLAKEKSDSILQTNLSIAVVNYIIQKIDRIAENYIDFRDGYDFILDPNQALNSRFLERLSKEKTHITFKLEQAIHFLFKLQFDDSQLGLRFRNISGLDKDYNEVFFSPDELLSWMGNQDGLDIYRYMPPSLFQIDFELGVGDAVVKFSNLSSGEQQLVHVIQTVIYHINNIQSVHYAISERPCYNAINIIYDEIELYFHPEFQRQFINELLKTLKRLYLGAIPGITSINIIFLTHSPFILSDIPNENILLLDYKKDKDVSGPTTSNSQTFAANIHTLFADGFFLKETLMGTFAEQIISGLIERSENSKELSLRDRQILNLIGDSFLKIGIQHFINRTNDKNTSNGNRE